MRILNRTVVILVLMECGIVIARNVPANKQKISNRRTAKPLRFFQELGIGLGQGLGQLMNPENWQQPQEQVQYQQLSTESSFDVITDMPIVVNVVNPNSGVSEQYTTGDTSIDRTITSFFGALTQIMDNMFKTFVTPAMNGTIWDDTPRPNGSGGLSNFLSSFFCQIFMGVLSPNYNGRRCFVYRYPSTTRAPVIIVG
ncbi:uncharacterized protein LOC132193206 isoform X2 [Neocloeon triangulifer]|uniref:uncharacterized protein LOC132193206 isoform X2 n=1 Tax=Neocloeon triangulifer TaxID=2078957 RepID=UPI00286F1C5A|nr:uncharacterized protein LOC132193206 isoform X2 [Neocloeon triangulifer]